ncbi:AraC-like DNA-binding protein [Streptacidiphilus sp. BW17]|uniref:AraC family transcriptional regulator n=1 Tax=Streptacidiphilus sp. BW17 TaxID=3156274 RepID=UPI00351439E7
MDVVSDAIAAVRVGNPETTRVSVTGTWCTRIEGYQGAGFHVVLRGSCWLLPDSGDAPVSLGPGDAVLLPHGTGHILADSPTDERTVRQAVPLERWFASGEPFPGTVPDPGDTVQLLCGKYRLDRSRKHPLLAELPAVVHLPSRVGGNQELRAAIDLLGRELELRGPGSCIAVQSLLDLLLVYMIRSWMSDGAVGAWPGVLSDPVAAAALRALHTDPAATWTNDSLAVASGVSRATLARRFTTLVGRPPMAYLGWWRLTLAARMLRDTQDPLATIARRVGYGSPYAFSHAFRREFGTTPGRHRETADGRRRR